MGLNAFRRRLFIRACSVYSAAYFLLLQLHLFCQLLKFAGGDCVKWSCQAGDPQMTLAHQNLQLLHSSQTFIFERVQLMCSRQQASPIRSMHCNFRTSEEETEKGSWWQTLCHYSTKLCCWLLLCLLCCLSKFLHAPYEGLTMYRSCCRNLVGCWQRQEMPDLFQRIAVKRQEFDGLCRILKKDRLSHAVVICNVCLIRLPRSVCPLISPARHTTTLHFKRCKLIHHASHYTCYWGQATIPKIRVCFWPCKPENWA